MANFTNFLLGALGEAQKKREQGSQLQQMLQKAMMEAQIKQQTQQVDPSQILSQLELMNLVKKMREQGGMGGQPTGQPTGQAIRGIPAMGQPPQGQMLPPGGPSAQTPMQPNLARRPIAPTQTGRPTVMQQPQQQGMPSPFIQLPETETGKYGQQITKYKTVKSPAYELEQKKQAEIRGVETGVKKQVLSQEAKKSAETQRLSKTAFTKMDTMFGAWLDTVARTYELTGIKPGPQQAPLTAILGKTRLNEFQEAFKGAQPEYAAAIGRMAVPGARSVRLIDLFKKGAPSVWSSIPSGIINSARSARMQFAGYLATEEGSKALGVPYDPANPLIWKDEANKILRNFEELYKEGLNEMVFMRNPNLLDTQTRNRLNKEFQAEMNRRKLNGRLQ